MIILINEDGIWQYSFCLNENVCAHADGNKVLMFLSAHVLFTQSIMSIMLNQLQIQLPIYLVVSLT